MEMERMFADIRPVGFVRARLEKVRSMLAELEEPQIMQESRLY